MNVKIESSWKKVLNEEFKKPYFKELTDFVREAYQVKPVFPLPQNIFQAFELCPFDQVKVVILGQDPYHGPGQAHGLCFSVQEGIKTPPSLMNIYKEIKTDVGGEIPPIGDLTHWAEQGVFLLNATLTVEAHRAGSHQNKGWEVFTDEVIRLISERCENVVFILWGAYAQKKAWMIDESKHLILSSPHPSPLSAHRGFFGNQHFSKANNYLSKHQKTPIKWFDN